MYSRNEITQFNFSYIVNNLINKNPDCTETIIMIYLQYSLNIQRFEKLEYMLFCN